MQAANAALFLSTQVDVRNLSSNLNLSLSDESPTPEADDATLDEVVREEREYVRSRLREELQREPTEEEVDEWLRRHTEGY
ncbi:MAG: hypothetical protein H7Y30_11725 [Pyrinomonadaceae bacterium]|nr:hypothetical protein [Pyrinomonadaceae bacterium]